MIPMSIARQTKMLSDLKCVLEVESDVGSYCGIVGEVKDVSVLVRELIIGVPLGVGTEIVTELSFGFVTVLTTVFVLVITGLDAGVVFPFPFVVSELVFKLVTTLICPVPIVLLAKLELMLPVVVVSGVELVDEIGMIVVVVVSVDRLGVIT